MKDFIMSAASSSSVRPRTSSPRPWPRLFNLDLLFHTHLTCGEDLAKDLCSDLRCAALMQGLQKARLGSSSPAWLLCCAGTQEASHFQGERGAALNFHGNKAVTKAEHELFPWQQLRRSLSSGQVWEQLLSSLEDVTSTVRGAIRGNLSACRGPFPAWDPPVKPASLSSASAQGLCCPQLHSANSRHWWERRGVGWREQIPVSAMWEQPMFGAASTAALNSHLPSDQSRFPPLGIVQQEFCLCSHPISGMLPHSPQP